MSSASSVATSSVSALDRVAILSEALPYLQRFQDKTIVIKYGGAAMKDPGLKAQVIHDVVLLRCVGMRPVLIHGGGPSINTMLSKVGIESRFIDGMRVTDADTMEVVEMVLTGKVNKSIVSLINNAGGSGVGVCGKDGRLLAARRVANRELGYVGEVEDVNTSILNELVEDGHIPVVATVAGDIESESRMKDGVSEYNVADTMGLNVNADIAAGSIASAMNAEKLVLMTDVPGVMMDHDDPESLVRETTSQDAVKLIEDKIVRGGMIPKVNCCVTALANGVKAAHIIDGREPHSLLMEILTDVGCGTKIDA